MIQFTIKSNEFSYDLRALAQSFYPEHPCQIEQRAEWKDRSTYPVVCVMDGEVILREELPEGYTKNSVKQLVYRLFAGRSGRTLPWGILTGIRPTKIPLRMMMAAGLEENNNYAGIERCLVGEYFVDPRKAKLAVDVAGKEYDRIRDFDHRKGYNLYIGIPFCPSICQYCSFSSYDIGRFRDRVDDYLTALEKEMAYVGENFSHRELHTIYVGGGTPTSISERQLERLLNSIHRFFLVEQAAEFTVEAGRPDSITQGKLEIMKKADVTRISINPQTMKQHTLELLGRKHTVCQIQECMVMARQAGFDHINMDLIVGLPEETEEDFINTLRQVDGMSPDSVTVHTLVIKRASRMRREQMENMERGGEMFAEDLLIPVLQNTAEDFLRGRGYEPYYMYRQKNKAGTTRNTNQENVAYARPGKECLYNIFIMEELETIVALGSGGSTKVVYPDENRMERIENVKSVEDYIARIDEMIERKREQEIWKV